VTPEDEITYIESRLHNMSFGHIEYSPLTQRLLALRAAQKIEHAEASEQSRKESESKWYKEPLGLIFIGAAGGVLTSGILYFLEVYFGIRL